MVFKKKKGTENYTYTQKNIIGRYTAVGGVSQKMNYTNTQNITSSAVRL